MAIYCPLSWYFSYRHIHIAFTHIRLMCLSSYVLLMSQAIVTGTCSRFTSSLTGAVFLVTGFLVGEEA